MINLMTRANQGLHYGGTGNKIRNVFVTTSPSGSNYATSFHTYAIDWTATSIACAWGWLETCLCYVSSL